MGERGAADQDQRHHRHQQSQAARRRLHQPSQHRGCLSLWVHMTPLSQTPPLGVAWETGGVLDERWIRSLHVEALREAELHAERQAHVLFQASTIGALLEGAYDGDLTFAELAEHGDLGLGTLNGLDGEMIALDGRFYRADVDGNVTEVAAETK